MVNFDFYFIYIGPTLKVKRNDVSKIYTEMIDKFYN